MPPPGTAPRPMELSVGALTGRINLTVRFPADEPLRLVQRHAAGRPPVVVLAGARRAVRPAVVVHRQGVVRFGPLVFRPSADEIDAIVHQHE